MGDCALTIARGAGKSSFIAGISGATLDGPLVEENSECVIVAPSLSQSRIIFRHVLRYLGSKLENKKEWRVWDTSQRSEIEHRKTHQTLKCLGSDPRRLHGLQPRMVICDESAQFSQNTVEETFSVLRTSLGKIPGGRFIGIGTRPLEGMEHPFLDLLAEADYVQAHQCVKDKDGDFQRRSWEKACPSLKNGAMPDLLQTVRREAARAKKNPNELASFRALRLNMGTAPVNRSHLIDPDLWRTCEVDEPERAGGYVLALDLSDGASMCGAAGYWPASSTMEVLAAFPRQPDLATRGARDGVGGLYQKCEKEGTLFTTPGLAVDIPALLRRVLAEWGRPSVIVADRYREKDLRQCLQQQGFPWTILVLRGMGFYHGAEDVRAFRRAALDGKIKARRSLLIRSALSESVTVSDPAGNEKLAKGVEGGRRKRARDDVAAAAVAAIGEGQRRGPIDSPEAEQPGSRIALV